MRPPGHDPEPTCRDVSLTLTHLQHGVQHVDLTSLLSSLRQSKALRWAHPGDPLDHSLHPGEFHQHILVLWTQAMHIHCVVNRLTHHLCGTRGWRRC